MRHDCCGTHATQWLSKRATILLCHLQLWGAFKKLFLGVLVLPQNLVIGRCCSFPQPAGETSVSSGWKGQESTSMNQCSQCLLWSQLQSLNSSWAHRLLHFLPMITGQQAHLVECYWTHCLSCCLRERFGKMPQMLLFGGAHFMHLPQYWGHCCISINCLPGMGH